MQVIDAKFKGNRARYVLQCMLATFCVFVVLLVLDAVTNAASHPWFVQEFHIF